MNQVFVVVYKDTTFNHEDTILGVIENESQFTEWLYRHNYNRRTMDEDYFDEIKDDFQLVRVPFFKS